MKRFKTIFYTIYIITIFLVLLISYNIYESLELFKKIGWYKYFSDLPFIGRNLLYYLSGLMVLEIIVENISLFGKKRKISSLKREIMELKSRRFDKSESDQEIKKENEEDQFLNENDK
jgi:hypothetical protein